MQSQKKIALYDGSFISYQRSATLGNLNSEEEPSSFEWEKDGVSPIAFYTDMLIEKILDYHSKHVKNVAWLIEPPSLSDTHYHKAIQYEWHFERVLTFDKVLTDVDTTGKWLYYPLGGSWIPLNQWGTDYPKTKLVSIIGTQKERADGHILRRAIIDQMDKPCAVDVYGRGYNPVESKVTALAPYSYSIVVESCNMDAYFSEKLIDCMSVGTIPIYWGCGRSLSGFFDTKGVIQFADMEQLYYILSNVISEEDALSRKNAVEANFLLARKYRCAEDWIFENYPFLFDEGKSQ